MKKVVAFDLDGLFSNHHYSFSIIANRLFGTPIIEDINNVKSYYWHDWHELTKEQTKLTWKEIDKNVENFWLDARSLVTPSIFKRLKNLELANHELYFVTSRRNTAGASALHQTTEWITNMSGLSNFSVIITEKKGKILDGINANYFIDDLPSNIIDVVHESPKCKNFLLVRPYNSYSIEFFKKSHKYKNVNFVYTVGEFLDEIEKGNKNV